MSVEDAREGLRELADQDYPGWGVVVTVVYAPDGEMVGSFTTRPLTAPYEVPMPSVPLPR